MCSTGEQTLATQCRLCTKTEGDFEPIFGESNRNLPKMIYDNVSLTIEENSPLPKMICTSCRQKLEEFNSFRECCNWSNDYFKSSLKEKQSSVFEPECCLNEEENASSVPQDKAGAVEENCEENHMTVDTGENLGNITTPVINTPHSNEISETHSSKYEERETILREPHPEDYVLVKQETFTLKTVDESPLHEAVEFCKPTVFSSDKVIVNDMWKKREVLPQMWDVYEKKTEENILIVTRRRYLISKSAFPCSLCNSCVTVKSEKFEMVDSVKKEKHFEVDELETEDGSEPLVCEFCLKSFPRRASLRRHIQSHYDFKSLPCKLCGRGFSRKEHLARHMLLHTGSRPYSCDMCCKTFTRKEHLTRHQSIYHEKSRCQIKPTLDDQEIIRQNGTVAIDKVQQSTSDDTKPAKPYTCKECGAGFGRKEHLLRHHQRAHSPLKARMPSAPLGLDHDDGRPYTCKLCSRSFTRKEHLLRHHKVHLRDNMFINESQLAGSDISHSFNSTT